MHKMRKKCAQNAQERDKDAQKMASQKVPQIVAKSVPVLGSTQIFFQGHCNFYFYFLFISQAQAEIFRPIFLASRYHFSKFCQGCESEGRVDSVRAHPRLRARLGGSEVVGIWRSGLRGRFVLKRESEVGGPWEWG